MHGRPSLNPGFKRRTMLFRSRRKVNRQKFAVVGQFTEPRSASIAVSQTQHPDMTPLYKPDITLEMVGLSRTI